MNLNERLYLENLSVSRVVEITECEPLDEEDLTYVIRRFSTEHSKRLKLYENLVENPIQELTDSPLAYMLSKMRDKYERETKHLTENTGSIPDIATKIVTHRNAGEYTANMYQKLWLRDETILISSKLTADNNFTEYFRTKPESYADPIYETLLSQPLCSPFLAYEIAALYIHHGNPEKAYNTVMRANFDNTVLSDITRTDNLLDFDRRKYLDSRILELNQIYYRCFQKIEESAEEITEATVTAMSAIKTLQHLLEEVSDSIGFTSSPPSPTPEVNLEAVQTRTSKSLSEHLDRKPRVSTILIDPKLPEDYGLKVLLLQSNSVLRELVESHQKKR